MSKQTDILESLKLNKINEFKTSTPRLDNLSKLLKDMETNKKPKEDWGRRINIGDVRISVLGFLLYGFQQLRKNIQELKLNIDIKKFIDIDNNSEGFKHLDNILDNCIESLEIMIANKAIYTKFIKEIAKDREFLNEYKKKVNDTLNKHTQELTKNMTDLVSELIKNMNTVTQDSLTIQNIFELE